MVFKEAYDSKRLVPTFILYVLKVRVSDLVYLNLCLRISRYYEQLSNTCSSNKTPSCFNSEAKLT